MPRIPLSASCHPERTREGSSPEHLGEIRRGYAQVDDALFSVRCLTFHVILMLLLLACTPALAVGTSHWTHSTEADFKAGKFEGVVATNLGDLKLSRSVKTLLEQDARVSAVYALAEAPDGTVYAGTGPQGVLLRIRGEDVSEVTKLEDGTRDRK